MQLDSEPRLSPWPWGLFIILTVTLGLQLLRAQLAYYRYLFGDRFGWSPFQMGGLALALFASVILYGLLARRMAPGRLATRSAFAVGLMRLLSQLWPGEPLVDFTLVTLGLLAFLIFLPALLTAQMDGRIHHPRAGWRTGVFVLAGLALDAAVHGLFFTYDPIWQRTWSAIGVSVLLVVLQGLALQRLDASIFAEPHPREGSFRRSLAWLALGPFLAYHLIVGGNLARLDALTGWDLPVNLAWLLLGLLLAVILARWVRPGRAAAVVATLWLAIGIVPPLDGAIPALVSLLIGQSAAGLLLTTAFTQLTVARHHSGVRHTTLAVLLAVLLFVLLLFLYYVTFEVRLPISRPFTLYLTALLAGLPLLFADRRWGFAPQARPLPGRGAGLFQTACLAVLVAAAGVTTARWHTPVAAAAGGERLRLFDYNIHNGYNMQGRLDLEGIARQIEQENPDIVTLQEVSRGWVVNGSVDTLAWLSQRLGLAARFSPSASRDWGHALLTHFPVTRHEVYALPPPGLPLARSFAYHELDIGQERPLLLINTHYHHRDADDAIREQQTADILHFLQGNELRHLILTGDLNATPDQAAITRWLEAGFVDLVAASGISPGYTYSSREPVRRLDYILATPDIGLGALTIPPGTASDHLGIRADLILR